MASDQSLLNRLRVQRAVIEELQVKRAKDQAEIAKLRKALAAVDRALDAAKDPKKERASTRLRAVAKALEEAER